jgi:hypothetical protein
MPKLSGENRLKTPPPSRLLSIGERFEDFQQNGRGYKARCPAHNDTNPSLSISEGKDGRILIHCFAGCQTAVVLAKVGLRMADLMPRPKGGKTCNGTGPLMANGQVLVRDLGPDVERFAAALTPHLRRELAELLGLPEAALLTLPQLGYSAADGGGCWTFPETDGAGRLVGITRRYRDGTKKALSGSRRGLTVPVGWERREGPIFLPEGPSDTLALTALGLAAIGRPSNTGGVEQLCGLLGGGSHDRQIIVLGEMDPKQTGQWPGRDGALRTAARLAELLGRPVAWGLPPANAKDARAWVQAQRLHKTCASKWSEAGQAFLSGVLPTCQCVGSKAVNGTGTFRRPAGKAQPMPTLNDYHPLTKPEGRTDTNNAIRLGAKYGAAIRWVGHWDKWLIWDESRWKMDQALGVDLKAKDIAAGLFVEIADGLTERKEMIDDKTRNAMFAWAKYSNSKNGICNMVVMAKSDLAIGPEKLDSDPCCSTWRTAQLTSGQVGYGNTARKTSLPSSPRSRSTQTQTVPCGENSWTRFSTVTGS